MKKILLLVLLIGVYIFLNVGKWIDVSHPPVKSEIVACLGGGTVERVETSIKLFKEGYVENILMLGESWYHHPYLKKCGVEGVCIIEDSPKSTEEEIAFLIAYMKKHDIHTALIVTDPPHTKRVEVLISQLLTHGTTKFTLHLRIVGSEVAWWNKKRYYQNKKALSFVWHEIPKIVYRVVMGQGQL